MYLKRGAVRKSSSEGRGNRGGLESGNGPLGPEVGNKRKLESGSSQGMSCGVGRRVELGGVARLVLLVLGRGASHYLEKYFANEPQGAEEGTGPVVWGKREAEGVLGQGTAGGQITRWGNVEHYQGTVGGAVIRWGSEWAV